jgi:hypothetical protein
MFMKARMKPVTIDFEIYDGTPDSVNRIIDMYGKTRGINNSPEGLYIVTLEGTMRADRGDYVIRGVSGEIYPCKPDIFLQTYDIIQ